MPFDSKVPGVTILAKVTPEFAEILTPEALTFIATLHRTYEKTRQDLLQRRVQRQLQLDQGQLPDFLPETRAIREDATWRAAKPAPGLQDRRVEITGPVDRKMVINALNSGAATFMADFEGKLKSPPSSHVCSKKWRKENTEAKKKKKKRDPAWVRSRVLGG